MESKNICKYCKCWLKSSRVAGFGTCHSFKFINDSIYFYKSLPDHDTLCYYAGQDDLAWFNTGENFGCVHFDQKEEI